MKQQKIVQLIVCPVFPSFFGKVSVNFFPVFCTKFGTSFKKLFILTAISLSFREVSVQLCGGLRSKWKTNLFLKETIWNVLAAERMAKKIEKVLFRGHVVLLSFFRGSCFLSSLFLLSNCLIIINEFNGTCTEAFWLQLRLSFYEKFSVSLRFSRHLCNFFFKRRYLQA